MARKGTNGWIIVIGAFLALTTFGISLSIFARNMEIRADRIDQDQSIQTAVKPAPEEIVAEAPESPQEAEETEDESDAEEESEGLFKKASRLLKKKKE